jgi:hypothetical protein
LILALDGDEWSASHPGRFTPGEIVPGTHWIEGWVGPRASLDVVEKKKILPLLGSEPRPSSLLLVAIPTLTDVPYIRYYLYRILFILKICFSISVKKSKECWREH